MRKCWIWRARTASWLPAQQGRRRRYRAHPGDQVQLWRLLLGRWKFRWFWRNHSLLVSPGFPKGHEKATQAWADNTDRALLERTPDTRSETSSYEMTSESSSKWHQGEACEAEEEQTPVIAIKRTFGDPRSKKVHPAPPTECTTCQEMLSEPSFNWPLGEDAQGQEETPASSPSKGRGLWKKRGKVQPALDAQSKPSPRTDPEQSSSSAQRQGRGNQGLFPGFWSVDSSSSSPNFPLPPKEKKCVPQGEETLFNQRLAVAQGSSRPTKKVKKATGLDMNVSKWQHVRAKSTEEVGTPGLAGRGWSLRRSTESFISQTRCQIEV